MGLAEVLPAMTRTSSYLDTVQRDVYGFIYYSPDYHPCCWFLTVSTFKVHLSSTRDVYWLLRIAAAHTDKSKTLRDRSLGSVSRVNQSCCEITVKSV